MNIPDRMPQLVRGLGETPPNGGCIMEVVDYLTSGGFTDHPECVHSVLRSLAIKVNDRVDDDERQKLWHLVPRLVNTAIADEQESRIVGVKLACFLARKVLQSYEDANPGDMRPRQAIEAAEAWAECPCSKHAPSATAAYAAVAIAATAAIAAATSATTDYVTTDYAAAIAATAAYAASATTHYADAAAATAYAYAASALVPLLIQTLDEYDRLVDRTTYPDIDVTPVCAVLYDKAEA